MIEDPCQCTEHDFECGPGFRILEKNRLMYVFLIVNNLRNYVNLKVKLLLPNKVLVEGNKCNMGDKKLEDFVSQETLKCSDYVDNGGDGNGDEKTLIKEILIKLKFILMILKVNYPNINTSPNLKIIMLLIMLSSRPWMIVFGYLIMECFICKSANI